jgi:excisionase family DNA binding protein
VAGLLDEDESQIRRMVAHGQLEAHRVGKRGIRIFLDSVEAWQAANRVKATKALKSAPPAPQSRPTGAAHAAHKQAVAHLRALGLV